MIRTVKKGFTLVEMLIVIAIIGMLSTMAVAGYSAYRKSVLLDLYAENVVSAFDEFKQKAILGETVIDEAGKSEINCYGFEFSDVGLKTVSSPFLGKKKWDSATKKFVYTGCDFNKIIDYPYGLELDPSFKISNEYQGYLLFEPPFGALKSSVTPLPLEVVMQLAYGDSNNLVDTRVIRYDVEKSKATILRGDEETEKK